MQFQTVNIDGADDNTEWKRENGKGKMGVKYIKMNIWLELIAAIVLAPLTLNSLIFHFLAYKGKGNNENAIKNARSYVSLRVQNSAFTNLQFRNILWNEQ